jgi:hypothetical protein
MADKGADGGRVKGAGTGFSPRANIACASAGAGGVADAGRTTKTMPNSKPANRQLALGRCAAVLFAGNGGAGPRIGMPPRCMG